MSSRYYLTAQKVTLSCGIATVDMISKPTEHLWLLVSFHYPRVHTHPDRRQLDTVPHHLTYDMYVDLVIEQQEPGQTLFHTFQFAWPAGAETIWLYTINRDTGPTKPTRSALFVYSLNQVIVFSETWQNGLNGQHPWVFEHTLPSVPPITTGKYLTITNSPAGGSTATLDVEIGPDSDGISLCDLYLIIGASKIVGGNQTFILVELEFTSPEIPNVVQRYVMLDVGSIDPCAFSTDGQHYFLHHEANDWARISFGDLLNSPAGPCDTAQTAMQRPTLVRIILATLNAGNVGIPIPNETRWSGVTLLGVSGELEDISRVWRHRRVHPLLP